MSLLNFLAMEPPQRARVIEQQARDALGPFERYLFQARKTATERQKRHRFEFEVVRRQLVYRLRPLDTLVLLHNGPSRWLLHGWPTDAPPDVAKKLNNETQECYVTVSSLVQSPQGWVIETKEPVQASDVVVWCGHRCTLKPSRSDARPVSVLTPEGRRHTVRWWGHDGDEELVCLEGEAEDGEFVVDGQRRHATVMPPWPDNKRVRDSHGREFPVSGEFLKSDVALSGDVLLGDKGMRFRAETASGRVRAGNWVQLLLPEDYPADQASIDPRAEFCEADQVREVWTAAWKRDGDVIRVFDVDRDRYQLKLERLPPKSIEFLYAPLDTRAIDLQKRAVQQLRHSPLPGHRGLLRLCENPEKVWWPAVPLNAGAEPDWELLKYPDIDGTGEQREFVRKALATPDVCLLEGPPGSGKTTAICELVLQSIKNGERVLLCASTHVAIDNALEKLYHAQPGLVEAVRIGLEGKVDDKVKCLQIDQRIDEVVEQWQSANLFSTLSPEDRREAAASLVVMSANLTCGTTAGIVNHPQLNSRRTTGVDRPLTTFVPWDLLIIDEASKTTVQEFFVPALLARRHVIVGDVQQLPPFTDIRDLEANIEHMTDEQDRPVLPPAKQRARLLLWRLLREGAAASGARWLVVEPRAVLDELQGDLVTSRSPGVVVRVGRASRDGGVPGVTVDDLRHGTSTSLWTVAAEWLLVDREDWGDVAAYLPPGFIQASATASPAGHPWPFRQLASIARAPGIRPFKERGRRISTREELERGEREFLSKRTWAAEVAWRLKRAHELRWSADGTERSRMQRGLEELVPAKWQEAREPVQELRDIGLPSVMEVIQEGVGAGRTKRRSALVDGLRSSPRNGVFTSRFSALSYQHRMHPEISDFPRAVVYERLARRTALRDANTIAQRDRDIDWSFAPWFKSRRAWMDVRGAEHRGVNEAEVRAMRATLREFLDWAEASGPPRGRKSGVWEVACLCFYLRQEEALSWMVQDLLDSDARHCFQFPSEQHPLVEIRCGTVDRFQGREADLVLLSMRNTRRVGFLDSPNRLNVAVTRARQQLVIFGDYGFFRDDERVAAELRELAKMTRVVKGDTPR